MKSCLLLQSNNSVGAIWSEDETSGCETNFSRIETSRSEEASQVKIDSKYRSFEHILFLKIFGIV